MAGSAEVAALGMRPGRNKPWNGTNPDGAEAWWRGSLVARSLRAQKPA